MHRLAFFVAFLFLGLSSTQAQWDIEASHTTADLRGIDNVGKGIAWASGSDGTVLRTIDNGTHWQTCAVPPDAGHLDFRGIQAFDASTAIVMSSGKGDLSRLYKTTDACQTWKPIFTNPDPEGFWDAMQFARADKKTAAPCFGVLVGDPVRGRFPMFVSFNCGDKWESQIRQFPKARQEESLFAASNSSLIVLGLNQRAFVTGGASGARIFQYLMTADDTRGPEDFEANAAPGSPKVVFRPRHMQANQLPFTFQSQSSGAFAVASNHDSKSSFIPDVVVVGGDYRLPDHTGFACHGILDGDFHAAQIPPHGFRSAVAYDATTKTWITVGPNGTDISTDDGRNWHALHPDPDEPADADQHWNALSLPFVVGPHGRIGKLNAKALAP
jgi:hypothetical protein